MHLHQRSDKLTWKAGLDYQLTPDNFLYGSISTGYKPGGGNPGTAPAVVPANYAPETITAFEVGSKNSFFDNTLIANLAGFYYIDKNMQYHAEDLINFDGGVDNLPKVDIYGIEGEFTALLPYHFRISGNLHGGEGQYRDARLDHRQSGRQCRQQRLRDPVRLSGVHRRRIRHPESRAAERTADPDGAAGQGLSRCVRQCAAEPAHLHGDPRPVADLHSSATARACCRGCRATTGITMRIRCSATRSTTRRRAT